MPKTTKKIVRNVYIGVRQVENEVLKKIEDEGDSIQEIIRMLIKNYGKEHFPPEPGYVQIKKEELEIKKLKMEFDSLPTEERIKKNFGLKTKNGSVFSLTYGGVWTTPLVEASLFTNESKVVQRHNEVMKAILENTPIEANGQVIMTIEELAERKREWEEI